jgi:carbon monoxide dehydrogenase subunit G
MLHFEGDNDFPLSPAELLAKLGDARFLAECIPGVEAIVQAEPDLAVCQLRPGFSFVRGTLEITLRIAEIVPGVSVRYLVHGKGIGSFNDVEAELRLAPQGGQTHVHWIADIKQLGGLLKAVPQGLIKASAQKVIADIWDQVRAKLGGASGATGQ